MIEILEFCREPRQKTEIIYKNNMTHANTVKKLKILTTAKLLTTLKVKNKKSVGNDYYYQTTNYGLEWLESMKKLLSVVKT
jgi:predicted transcriptional regulator